MKIRTKRFLGAVLSLIMLLSCLTISQISVQAADLNVSGAGWFESAYAEWQYVSGAGYYEAYVKASSSSTYEQVDDELIRQYDTYMRVDAVGLPAGSYDLKIVAYDKEGGNLIAEKEVTNIAVKAYDRSGSCFSSTSIFANSGGVGAYKNDGSLKDNAKVFYVTAETAKTITTDVITNKSGGTTTYTGLQDIIYGYQKGYDTTPIDFRIIGTITADDVDYFGSSAEGLQIKGKNDYSELNITIEGIGNDAAFYGFGMLIRYAGNVEIRNLGMLWFMDDGISMDTGNANIWVHNVDLYYGQPGGDSDQAKGDGSVDIKGDSKYVTVSYCHFWDSGKSSLCGLNETDKNFITYHHNWFDHSDSRHPRVRTMSVHLYNNYFDGVSKYGAGSSLKSSVFAESNYFRSCKYPLLTGKQGHEAGSVFSDSYGGTPVKSYNNIMTGSYQYTSYQDDPNDFDAYEASSRNEQIPSSIVADGGAYNNFDTTYDIGVTASDIDNPADVPAIVMSGAGRCNGSDFFYTFYDDEEDTNYDVNTDLQTKIKNYTTTLRVVGGTVDTSKLNSSAKASSATGVDGNTSYIDRDAANAADAASLPTESTEPSSSSGGSSAYKLKLDGTSLGSTATGGVTSNQTGLGTDGAFSVYATTAKTVTFDSSKGIMLGGAGSTAARCIVVTIPAEADEAGGATIYVKGASTSSDTRYVAISDGSTVINATGTASDGTNTYDTTSIPTGETGSYGPVSSGTYYIYSTYKGINVSLVGVAWGGDDNIGDDPADDDDPVDDDTTEATTDEETEDTTDEPNTEDTTTAPVSGDFIWNKTTGENTLGLKVGSANDWSSAKDNPITYNGSTLTSAYKMESSTNLSFTTGAAGTLTVVTYATSASPTIKIDGTTYTVSSNGATTVELEAGTHTITKGTASTYLYYLSYYVEGGDDETTTEASSETTTEAKKDEVEIATVEFETSVNSDTEKNPDVGEIYYTDNGDGTHSIIDQNTNRTGNLLFSFDEISTGKVSISGTITPSTAGNNWTLVQVQGAYTDSEGAAAAGEVFGIRTSSGAYNMRIRAGSDLKPTTAAISADKQSSYEFIVDFDAQTVELIVDGASTGAITFADAGISAVDGIKFVTATGTRNLSLSTPVVSIFGNETDESTSDASTEVSTDETTDESTENTTDESTENTTDESTEDTTEEQNDGLKGDIDGNGKLTANDAAALLQYVISGNTEANEEWNVDPSVADVDGNGDIAASDAAKILRKVMDAAYEY